MTEFILARYPRRRRVYVDGNQAGFTNDVLAIGSAGFHDIDLGPEPNYEPLCFEGELIRNTSAVSPRIFVFAMNPVESGEGGAGEEERDEEKGEAGT